MSGKKVQKNINKFKSELLRPKISNESPPRYLQLKYTFVVFTLLVVYLYFNVDATVEQYVKGGFFAGTQYYFDKITHTGLAIYILIPLAVLMVIRLFIDEDDLSENLRNRMYRLITGGFFLLATIVISGIVAQILKFMIGRARPKFFLDYGPHYFEHFHKPGYDFASMPSGHSVTVAAFYVGLVYLLPKFRVIWIFLALLVAFSRVVLGSHYPSDVVFGLAVGAYTTIFIYYWMKNRGFFY